MSFAPAFYALMESWFLIIPLLLMCYITCYNEWESDYLFGALGLSVILYNVGVVWSDIHWYHGVAYIAIGICWCLFRYREFIKETALDYAASGGAKKTSSFKNDVSWHANYDKTNSWIFN